MAEKVVDGGAKKFGWLQAGCTMVGSIAIVVWLIITLYAYPNAKGVVLEAVMAERLGSLTKEVGALKTDVRALLDMRTAGRVERPR